MKTPGNPQTPRSLRSPRFPIIHSNTAKYPQSTPESTSPKKNQGVTSIFMKIPAATPAFMKTLESRRKTTTKMTNPANINFTIGREGEEFDNARGNVRHAKM
jgi:hypothetical protein